MYDVVLQLRDIFKYSLNYIITCGTIKILGISPKNQRIIPAIIIVAILIIAGVVTVVLLSAESKPVESIEKEIDDRISPYTNQALFLEIHRIRKKGIIDQMMNPPPSLIDRIPVRNQRFAIFLEGIKPGKGWDTKPVYNWVVTIDGYTEIGKAVFRNWDTGYINQVVWRDIKDEQAEAVVEIKFQQHITTQQFLRSSTSKKEVDAFSVTYDFKTGMWRGDDSFNDTDGYGHYDGVDFEIWFSLTQTSPDDDIIPFWVEVNILGTDPLSDDTNLDPDNDGIPTVWEWKWGYDPHVPDNHTKLDPDLDGLQNTEEYFMENWLANPFHQEIYLEADYMAQTPKKFLGRDGYDGWEHTFYKESQQMLMDRYNEHGYTLHVDDGTHGDMSEGGDILPFGRGNSAYQQERGIVAGFYSNNFPDERKGIWRYLVIAYGGGWCHPQDENHWYDCMCIPDNRNFFQNQLGGALSQRTIRIGQAIQILHEMGHSLGMLSAHFEGVDNSIYRSDDPQNYPYLDYVSVMNYDYFWERYFDYSYGENGEYDKDDWAELDLTFFQTPSIEMEGLGKYDDPLEEDPWEDIALFRYIFLTER